MLYSTSDFGLKSSKKGQSFYGNYLPDGRIGAIAAVHTFGDYLIFHPHLHVLAANGLFTPDGHFHCMPAEDLDLAIELFRQRFLHALREAKLISPGKLADLLSWKHSGFHIHDGGEKPVAAHNSAGRKRLAEYLLHHPFSLQKITWNASTQTVIYRSKRHYNTKRNFEIFKAPDFIAAALLHLPPKGQQTVRYYGTYSNKTRGQTPLIPDRIIRPPTPSSNQQSKINNHQSEILLIPAPPKQSARDMRPLWRDLILQVWGGDPLQCTCCKGTMKPVRKVIRREGNRVLPPPPRPLGGDFYTSAPATATLRHRDHRAYRTALAGDQGMDPRRRA
jgi:hypothetical protein